MLVHKDAFSNGQIDSKLWLCRELEKTKWCSTVTHIYGGWCGVLGFLLLSRENFKVDRIESYDLDPKCESIADMINENWVFKDWKFKAFTADCNKRVVGDPDLVINTSSEHFESSDWFENLAPGTRVVIQGNNMIHDDHVIHSTTLEDFIKQYPLSQIVYSGSLDFTYPDWGFTRYMVIGVK